MLDDLLKPPVKKPIPVVTTAEQIYQSVQGHYFNGQTEPIYFSHDTNAWGALFNPPDSGVILRVSVFTISNFSDLPLTAQVWLHAKPPSEGEVSPKLITTNLTLSPLPQPKVKILYGKSAETPAEGVNVFDRIVPVNTTVVKEEEGKLLIPPDGYLILLVPSPGYRGTHKVVFAYGWWEEKIRKH